ncbi:peroxiredoxin [Nitrosomonas eutropha]|uniref:thioredoxin-dependent peroxiredoxin n=2 Tax=Nitrosomonas eutropha TaxID=916 RepID=A0ABX5M5Y3_9PROT|nr:peroxiredoxin [Nitrosomonas eutropha]ABI59877.1 alkyl hydroperoxide reductase/ Thiol specific antioxidant/ Mal allergen [Nitrosomonas eutropha C91]PXV80121.1 peroxiredoxin Q/BCP [Nitrosomonas eutropha]
MPVDLIPDFELASTGNKQFRLSGIKSKYLVIFFYPKDDTPGCTNEGQQFRDLYPEFVQEGCEIVGISRDSLKSHEKFREKYNFPYNLLSDADEVVCELFGVIKMKNMYGKQVRGIERSTFILDREGKLYKAWRGVKVPGHAEEVLAFIKKI